MDNVCRQKYNHHTNAFKLAKEVFEGSCGYTRKFEDFFSFKEE